MPKPLQTATRVPGVVRPRQHKLFGTLCVAGAMLSSSWADVAPPIDPSRTGLPEIRQTPSNAAEAAIQVSPLSGRMIDMGGPITNIELTTPLMRDEILEILGYFKGRTQFLAGMLDNLQAEIWAVGRQRGHYFTGNSNAQLADKNPYSAGKMTLGSSYEGSMRGYVRYEASAVQRWVLNLALDMEVTEIFSLPTIQDLGQANIYTSPWTSLGATAHNCMLRSAGLEFRSRWCNTTASAV